MPLILLLLLGIEKITFAQGGFQNLDFESAGLSGYQFGTMIPIGTALPGWEAFYGSGLGRTGVTDVLYGGSPGPGGSPRGLTLRDTNFNQTVLQGRLSLMLVSPFGTSTATLSQTGLVPSDAQSLQFKIGVGTANFALSLGGQTIPVRALATVPGVYTLYGADISSFAGQTAELSLTAGPLQALQSAVLLDDILFSPTPIPEPGSFVLLVLALLVARVKIRMP